MTMENGPVPRRTQQERREGTIARLIEGTIGALAELGYTRATVKEICHRAGVSQGALFRYFRTRNELMAAAAAEVATRQLRSFAVEIERELDGDCDDPLTATVRLMQRRARYSINAVWYELLVAARTDPELRAAIAPVAQDYIDQVCSTAASQPFSRPVQPELLEAVVRMMLHVLGGEAVLDPTERRPDGDEHTVHLLVTLLRSLSP